MLNYFVLFFQDIELSIIHFGLPVVFPGPKNDTCTMPFFLACRDNKSKYAILPNSQIRPPSSQTMTRTSNFSRVNSRSGIGFIIIIYPQPDEYAVRLPLDVLPVAGRPHRCKDLLLVSVPTSLRQSPSSANSLDRLSKTPQKTACDDPVERQQGLDSGQRSGARGHATHYHTSVSDLRWNLLLGVFAGCRRIV
jgi:hypothetical protein